MPERRASRRLGPAGQDIRRALPEDLDAIVALERAAFQPWRQSSRDSLRRSLRSARQSVWVVDDPRGAGTGRGAAAASPHEPSGLGAGPAAVSPNRAGPPGASTPEASSDHRVPATASLVLWHHPKSLRVYGVAVRPDMQGRGLGRRLMEHVESLAARQGKDRIILEADVSDGQLVAWYEAQGYRRGARLPGFYGPGRDAWRLEKRL